ncbi:ubiquitin carboxyl-terminal hydrolase [Aspergillus sclerotialis]|uniref:Ubiquitin carboxyl-terminal hydrolase n=1 Tax=Aspergillus sclerotialis TaxID=2070753 RepID=A0A3A2ZUB3_9EURO|nr:ubiquitin carboxyl-terminal hydrolase [Aspergillus sclerotialis]
MSQRVKRRRLSSHHETNGLGQDSNAYLDDICRPASTVEKDTWNGFCEIESEPALFNVMLREFGVKGVRVQEVVSLDEEMMAFLNKPIYGLIFLFRWREDDPDKQEAICPERLWFANQTANNACASVALLNIVNNIDGIDLGENLQQFKDFTMRFTPALRGDAINNFEFVKRIHNSFARKMDILNSDLHLRNETTARRSHSSKGNRDSDNDGGFHFIAFVPVEGKVWKFDGLERQPQALGEYSQEDWLDLVKPNILTRMAEYEEDQIEFSILSLAKDPLVDLVGKLAANVKCLEIVQQRLKTHEEGSSNHELVASLLENTILVPDESYGLTRVDIDEAVVTSEQMEEYGNCTIDGLIQNLQKLSTSQCDLRATIKEEQQSRQADDDYAFGRRYDYGPAVRLWVRFLARKRMLESLE